MVHRDVSPSNLMITPRSLRVVLMDFGLAKTGAGSLSLSMGSGFLGKLRYAAPEQLASAALDVGPPADVRGLGVILWELLSRKRLFEEAEDERKLATLIHDVDVPLLSEIVTDVHPDIEAIVSRATERDSGRRIQTAQQLAEYIQMVLDGEPLPIRPPTTGELAHRWMRENKPLVSTAAVAAATLTIVIAIAFGWILQAKSEADAQRKIAELSRQDAERQLADKNRAFEEVRMARQEALIATDEATLNLSLATETLSRICLTLSESDQFAGGGLYGPQRELLETIASQLEKSYAGKNRSSMSPALMRQLVQVYRQLAESYANLGEYGYAEARAIQALNWYAYLSRLPFDQAVGTQLEQDLLAFEKARIITLLASVSHALEEHGPRKPFVAPASHWRYVLTGPTGEESVDDSFVGQN